MSRILVPAVLSAVALAVPSTALGQTDAITEGYGPTGAAEQSIVTTGGESNTAPESAQSGVAPSSSSAPSSASAPTSAAPTASAAQPQSASGSQLPFTGADLVWLALGGVLLLGVGLAVRRLTRA